MYTLIRLLPTKRLLSEQMPALGLAWLIAELFYKFRSFTLECIAFLVTWFVLDAVIQWIVRRLAKRSGQSMS
jgi:biotin transporter BioY